MEISKLTISKETMEKAERPLSLTEKGRLRWQRLKELEAEGKLSNARNRREISAMLGLGDKYGAGYAWVSAMVNGGFVSEILLGTSEDGRVEYEYHIVKEPGKEIREPEPTTKRLTAMPVKPEVTQPEPAAKGLSVTLKYKDLTIEISNAGTDVVESIVERLINQE